MSIHLTDVAITEYDAMVKAVYQAEGFKLRNTMRTKMGVVGSTVQFPKQGKGLAQQKATQDDVVPMNLNYDPVTVTLANWHAAEYSDIFDQQEVNFDDMKEIARAAAMAIGRRSDQIAIDALAASGTSNTIAAGGTGFTYAKYLTMNKFFAQVGVSRSEERFVVLNAAAEEDLLNEDKFINRDYTTSNLLSDGRLDGKRVMGYTWIVIPDMDEGGVASGFAYAWARQSIGFAVGLDMKTNISYENEKTSYLACTVYKAAATAIDNTGIVSIAYA